MATEMALAAAGLAGQAAAWLRLALRGGDPFPGWALWTGLAGAAAILVLALVRRDPVLALGQIAAMLPVLRPVLDRARRTGPAIPEPRAIPETPAMSAISTAPGPGEAAR